MASGVKVSKMNFELNPRGNLWFNDESTLGHKLLYKMGWSKGKGLGKHEDGIKENIKISKKETNTGVGWKNDEIPVAVGCLEYENILQNLQKHFNKSEEKPSKEERFEKSLEQRSRSARNHLHYQKYVRGKDLIRYSEKDMKSIFLEKPPKPVSNHPSHTPNSGTPTFESGLSVKDYFELKMQKKREAAAKSEAKDATVNNVSAQSRETGQELSKKRKFVSESPERKASKKAKLKKRNSEMPFPSPNEELVVADESSVSDQTTKSKKKKKKSKRRRLKQLKSCLRTKTAYDLEDVRNVSFNDQVSFKILDTSLELCEALNDTSVEQAMEEEEQPLTEENEADCAQMSSFTNEDEEEETEEQVEDVETDEQVEDVETEEQVSPPPCFDLPKCSGSNFNFWLESQRQASKMELYKEMAKKMRKNKILRSTNLLDIKGYGNWGL